MIFLTIYQKRRTAIGIRTAVRGLAPAETEEVAPVYEHPALALRLRWARALSLCPKKSLQTAKNFPRKCEKTLAFQEKVCYTIIVE